MQKVTVRADVQSPSSWDASKAYSKRMHCTYINVVKSVSQWTVLGSGCSDGDAVLARGCLRKIVFANRKSTTVDDTKSIESFRCDRHGVIGIVRIQSQLSNFCFRLFSIITKHFRETDESERSMAHDYWFYTCHNNLATLLIYWSSGPMKAIMCEQ